VFPVEKVFTPAYVSRSSGLCSRSWFPASSSSGAARRRCAPPVARRRRASVAASFLGPAQRRRLLLLPLTTPSQVEWKGKTPMGLVAWTTGSLPPPTLLNPGAATAGRNPLAAPAWTARATVAAPPPPLRGRSHRGVARGVKEDPPRSGFDSRASAPDPSACGSPGWRGRPIARPLCDAARLTRRRVQAKEKREEGKGKTETDEWALPSSERSKKKGKGFGCWAVVAGWVAGPARLLGSQRAFGRPAQ
jgi:hypothetical protein